MRTREEIKEEAIHNMQTAGAEYTHGIAIVELLLDIRELLLNPPVEITHNLLITDKQQET